MRALLMIVTGIGLSGSAVAFADSSMPPIDPASVPSACSAVAAVPADATIPQPAIEARIALASCGAQERFGAIKLTPDDAGMAALTAAAKPSFDLLDAAIAAGDATWTPIAQKARADLFQSMAVRMRNSIPPITMQTVGQALADHDAAHAALEPKIKPWLDQAH
jgi:hypothetical protein